MPAAEATGRKPHPRAAPAAFPWRLRSPRAWVLRVRGAATSASPPPVHPVRSAVGAGVPAGLQSTHRPPRCDRPEMGGQGTSASGGGTGRAWPSAWECPIRSLPACAPSGRWLLGCGASCRPQRVFSRPSRNFPSGTPRRNQVPALPRCPPRSLPDLALCLHPRLCGRDARTCVYLLPRCGGAFSLRGAPELPRPLIGRWQMLSEHEQGGLRHTWLTNAHRVKWQLLSALSADARVKNELSPRKNDKSRTYEQSASACKRFAYDLAGGKTWAELHQTGCFKGTVSYFFEMLNASDTKSLPC